MPIITTDKPMRTRHVHDYYPTPMGLIRAALNELPELNPKVILDPGCGEHAVWLLAARSRYPLARLYATDIRPIKRPCAAHSYTQGSYHHYKPNLLNWVDLVVGNPPYKLAEDFVRTSRKHLKPGGVIMMLLRLAFLEGQARGEGLWKDYAPFQVIVSSRRPSFTRNGKTDATAYALYLFGKESAPHTDLSWLDWTYV